MYSPSLSKPSAPRTRHCSVTVYRLFLDKQGVKHELTEIDYPFIPLLPFAMSTLARRTLAPLASAVAVAGPSRLRILGHGRRAFGFDVSGGSGNGSGHEARHPVVRDSLVPIVVEQTVRHSTVQVYTRSVRADGSGPWGEEL